MTAIDFVPAFTALALFAASLVSFRASRARLHAQMDRNEMLRHEVRYLASMVEMGAVGSTTTATTATAEAK